MAKNTLSISVLRRFLPKEQLDKVLEEYAKNARRTGSGYKQPDAKESEVLGRLLKREINFQQAEKLISALNPTYRRPRNLTMVLLKNYLSG